MATRKSDPTQGGKRAVPLAPEDLAEAAALAEEQDGDRPRGLPVLRAAIKTLPDSPGVYRMINRRGDVLYVGKARHLKRRVTTYTQIARLPIRLQRMVSETTKVEVTSTGSEVEALLLESNLIKRHRPRYNVLLRDDKSFPFILLTDKDAVPRLTKHRGAQKLPGSYYGPFASAGAVNRTITALEKAFLLRSCSDAVYASRTRPCLLHQIKRCAAPCVGRIGEADYAALVADAKAFLSGRAAHVKEELAAAMEQAAADLDFEQAARYRDRLRAMAHIHSHQDINVEGIDDADVVAAESNGGITCVQVFFFRAGRNYGNRAYFPSHDRNQDTSSVLGAFLAQFYEDKTAPRLVLISHAVPQQSLLTEALTQRAERKVEVLRPQRGSKKSLLDHALNNAREALARRLAETSSQQRLLSELAERIGLEEAPGRIEVYDNSHIQGSNAYGAMIVAGPEGFVKSAYRQFAIKDGVEGGDDYGMMRQVLMRRFQRALKEDEKREGDGWPDLVIVDGGRGQLKVAREVLEQLGITEVALMGVAKGPERDAGRERLFIGDAAPILLEPRDPVLYFLQRLRDEAHRFAIGTHRQGRSKSRLTSTLDQVPGIGAKRKKALLLHFGSARAVSRAGVADLQAVAGISSGVAQKIYDFFHNH